MKKPKLMLESSDPKLSPTQEKKKKKKKKKREREREQQ